MYGLIFANGDVIDGPAVAVAINHGASQLIIAADGGLRNALRFNFRPDLIIGDLDSARPEEVQEAVGRGAQLQQAATTKDETDLELALLAAARYDCDPIRIVGAIGDRIDQTLGNIYLMSLPELAGRDVRMVNGTQTVCLAHPGGTTINGHPGDTLSLLPLSPEVTGIVTEGLQYPLHVETLRFGPARGMSNVMLTAPAHIRFESGLLLLVHTVGRA